VEVRTLAAKHGIPVYTGTMETLGAMVGHDDAKVDKWLSERVKEHDRMFDLLARSDMPVQVSMLLLRMCMLPKMGYLARVMPPNLLLRHAKTFDLRVLETAKRRLGLPKAISTLQLPIRQVASAYVLSLLSLLLRIGVLLPKLLRTLCN
jgi:hypothetical protein